VSERAEVVVVGVGQAGLAVSYELTQAGVAHDVLERGRIGQTWRASTVADGLYLVGVHFLRTRKSSLFLGVGEDASLVARRIAAA
jgi:cation diffusion facilitator CzcD-associated flavoprotein CzcO